MITIQTKARKIILVEVPENATEIKLYQIYVSPERYLSRIEWENKTLSPFNSGDVGFDDYEILGTLTQGIPDFEVEYFVEFTGGITNMSRGGKWFLDYTIANKKSYTLEFSHDSFTSLLKSHKVDLEKRYVVLTIK